MLQLWMTYIFNGNFLWSNLTDKPIDKPAGRRQVKHKLCDRGNNVAQLLLAVLLGVITYMVSGTVL